MGCTGAPPAPAVVSAPPVVAFLPVCTGMFLRSMWLVLGTVALLVLVDLLCRVRASSSGCVLFVLTVRVQRDCMSGVSQCTGLDEPLYCCW